MSDLKFPNAPSGWSTDEADKTAEEMGIKLNDSHWQLVQALQEYFSKHEKVNRRELTDALEEKFHSIGGLKHLYQLLPGGPISQGCEIAGIAPPAGSVDEHFGSVV